MERISVLGKVADTDEKSKRTKMPFSSASTSKVYIYRVRLFDETLSRASIV
jgi:hypothetical protein